MNRIKTFEQYNIQDGEMVNEEFLDSIKSKIVKFLENPTDEKNADKLLQQALVYSLTSKATPHLRDAVKGLSLENKIKLLSEVADKLKDSPVTSLRLFQSPISKKLSVGTIHSDSDKQRFKKTIM